MGISVESESSDGTAFDENGVPVICNYRELYGGQPMDAFWQLIQNLRQLPSEKCFMTPMIPIILIIPIPSPRE